MADDEIKAAEKRGYQNGYAAGRRRLESDLVNEAKYVNRQDFLDAAFLVALPSCILSHDWSRGEKKITSLPDRTALAWDFAEAALKQRRHPT